MRRPAAILLAAGLLASGCHPKRAPSAPDSATLDLRVFQACQLALDEGLSVAQAAAARGLRDAIAKDKDVYGDLRTHALVMPTRDGTCMMAWAKGSTPLNREALRRAFSAWVTDPRPVKVNNGEAWCGREAGVEAFRVLVLKPLQPDLLAVVADADDDCLMEPSSSLEPMPAPPPADGSSPARTARPSDTLRSL